MTLQTFGPHEVGSKYHVESPVPKHVENSLHGSRYAKRHGYRTTDLDILPDEVAITRHLYDGHIPNDHWPKPLRRDGFRDPKHILHSDVSIETMVPEEWRRIVAGHRWTRLYHIVSIEEQLALCGQIRLQALIEPKHSEVFLRPDFWEWLATKAEQHGTRTAVYSLMHECLPFARQVGFEAWPIK